MAEFEFSYKPSPGVDYLYIDGPVIEVVVTAPLPLLSYLADNDLPLYPTVTGTALIDTGAAVSLVDESVMGTLNIPSIDAISFQTAHGLGAMRRYNASVSFPGLQLQGLPLVLAPGGMIRSPIHTGDDLIMLLGRDLLRRLTVTYDGPKSKIRVTT